MMTTYVLIAKWDLFDRRNIVYNYDAGRLEHNQFRRQVEGPEDAIFLD